MLVSMPPKQFLSHSRRNTLTFLTQISGAWPLYAQLRLWADLKLPGELVVLTLIVEMTQYQMEDFQMLPKDALT
jgi:hypothetical protein